MDTDGSNQMRLIEGVGVPDWGEVLPVPAWSPDGRMIAFNCEMITQGDYDGEIYVMGADGSDPTNLTNNPAYDAFPAWSPDGSKIAFISTRDEDMAIYVMEADGSNPTRLTEIVASDYTLGVPWYIPQQVWSPDGNHIAFPSDGAIYVIDADGGNLTRLTDREGVYILLAWSP